ncbi:MAG: hypothetical protein AAF961_14710, partial [Planctomycetota bacterium]
PTVGGETEAAAPGSQETWHARRDEFLLMSFKPDVVEAVLPQLRVVPAEHPGQVWLHVADLAGTGLAATINAVGFDRARQASVAASRLMNTLANQLHVPRGDGKLVAEQLVDGAFTCPLGGEYELIEQPGGLPMWASSALPPEQRFLLAEPPADYLFPMMTWFQGLRLDAALTDEDLAVHLEIDMDGSATP